LEKDVRELNYTCFKNQMVGGKTGERTLKTGSARVIRGNRGKGRQAGRSGLAVEKPVPVKGGRRGEKELTDNPEDLRRLEKNYALNEITTELHTLLLKSERANEKAIKVQNRIRRWGKPG